MRMHCQRNPLKYEYVLFPIFVGFWTLLALNNREKKLEIYNIPAKDLMIEEIFAKVVEFVKRELKFHEKKEIEVTGWRELSYEMIQFGLIDKVDSAAFAIRIAYKIAINNKAQVTHEIMHDFRYNLIIMLYKHGSQV